MNGDNLHPWIEPELEARLVALVLGEASDFEREELERLVAECPELAVFKKRIKAVHGLLREVSLGESDNDGDDWKLPEDRRAALLSVIEEEESPRTGEAASVLEPASAEPNGGAARFRWTVLARVAAVFVVIGAVAGVIMPLYYLDQPKIGLALRSEELEWANESLSNEKAVTTPQNLNHERWLQSMDESRGGAIPNAKIDRLSVVGSTTTPAPADEPRNALLAITDTLGVLTDSIAPDGGAMPPGITFTGESNYANANNRSYFIASERTTESLGAEEYRAKKALPLNGVSMPEIEEDSLGLVKRRNAVVESKPDDIRLTAADAIVTPGLEELASKNRGFDHARGSRSDREAAADRGRVPALGKSPVLTRGLGVGENVTSFSFDADGEIAPAPTAAPTLMPAIVVEDARIASENAKEIDDTIQPRGTDLGGGSIVNVSGGMVVLREAGQMGGGGGSDAGITLGTDATLYTRSDSYRVNPVPSSAEAKIAAVQENLARDGKAEADTEMLVELGDLESEKRELRRVSSEPIDSASLARGKAAEVATKATMELSRETADSKALEEITEELKSGPGMVRSLGQQVELKKSLVDSQLAAGTRQPAEPGQQSASPIGGRNILRTNDESSKVNLNTVEMPVSGEVGGLAQVESRIQGVASESAKLRSIIVPEVNFDDVPLEEAIEFLQQKSAELDVMDSGATNKGVRLYVQPAAGPEGGGDEAEDKENSPLITLNLRDVPLEEAIRYTTELAGRKYKVDSNGVEIVPLADVGEGLLTKVYEVPPDFLDLAYPPGASGAVDDPFGAPSPRVERPSRAAEITAKEVLEEIGIMFPPGASAKFNPVTNQLVLRNTRSNTELVGAFVDSVREESPYTNPPLSPEEEFNRQLERVIETQEVIDRERASLRDMEQRDPSENSAKKQDLLRLIEVHSNYLKRQRDILSELRSQVDRPVRVEVGETEASAEPFSTFSLHVSDVSFKLAKAALAKGEWPEADKIRIEEFVNAVDYGDSTPSQQDKVACRVEQAIQPFLQQRNLLRISMRTAAEGRSGATPLRLTFLLDNSGSMERVDRQETVRRAFALLTDQLQPMDQVTLISFARQPRLLADQVGGDRGRELNQIVANIPSEGGTNLEAALKLAFEKAREQQAGGAQNRVVLLTDGAANLGDANPESLARLIESMRDTGIAFDAAGIGADGLNDEILEALTRKGDGRYYLLDRPKDADAGFARQIAGALRPAAKNVKVQVEFNSKRVGRYKLLGFEKHRLEKEDFRNDSVDAAEMAAEEAGVAVYQFEPLPGGDGDVGSVSVRFRDMSTGRMVEKRWPIPYEPNAPRPDEAEPSMRIATAAALLAAKLKGEPLGEVVHLSELARVMSGLPERYEGMERVQQLKQMIEQARQLAGE